MEVAQVLFGCEPQTDECAARERFAAAPPAADDRDERQKEQRLRQLLAQAHADDEVNDVDGRLPLLREAEDAVLEDRGSERDVRAGDPQPERPEVEWDAKARALADHADLGANGEPREPGHERERDDSERRAFVLRREEPARGADPIATANGLLQPHTGADLASKAGPRERGAQAVPVAVFDPPAACPLGVLAPVVESRCFAREALGRFCVALVTLGLPAEQMVGPGHGRLRVRGSEDGRAIGRVRGPEGDLTPPPAEQRDVGR